MTSVSYDKLVGMLFSSPFRIIKPLVIFVTLAALVLGFFCVGMFDKTSVAMERAHSKTAMSIEAKESCCGDTMSQHMQSWTNTFLTTPNNLRDSLALLALIFLVSFVFVGSRFSFASIDQLLLSSKLYLRQRLNLFIFNPLRLAFAKGILHPKLY